MAAILFKTMTEIELFAKHYYTLGLNVTSISNHLNEHNFYCRNILKTPNHKWKHLFANRQLETEYTSYDWNNATGVGSVTGYLDIRVIDLDGCTDYNFLDKVLNLLGLPQNYEWVTLSGSKNGFHIFVISEKFPSLTEEQVVTTFPPLPAYKHIFDKVEILWNTHVVLPPSIHNSGSSYSFLNCRYPKSLPQVVEQKRIAKFINDYLEAEKKVIGRGYGEVLFEFIPPNIPSNLDEDDFSRMKNKTIICVIDIETDGLPKRKSSHEINGVEYPNVVQVAWILMDIEGTIYKKISDLINYPGIIQTEAFQINNIDINLVKRIGKTPSDVYKNLVSDVKIADYIVAHNVAFDIPIIRSQLSKYFVQDVFHNKKTICTMKETVNFCRIPSYDSQFKFPKLTELYEQLFEYKIEQKHNAESDALLTAKCFKELISKGILKLQNF